MAEVDYHGRFVWFDLMTNSPGDAVSFYTGMTGWGTEQWQGVYTMFTRGGVPMGGVMEMPREIAASGTPPHWLPYIGTPDTEAVCKRAESLGGKIHKPPEDIPTVGRFAVVADPQGAVFALFQPLASAPGHDGLPGPGEFSWLELATTDYVAAYDFYSKLFGWEKGEAMDMGEHGIYQIYTRAGIPRGGMFNKPAEMPSSWVCYIMVNDVRQTVEEVESAGGRVVNGPMEVPGGDLIAQCLDPQGGLFALHSRKAD